VARWAESKDKNQLAHYISGRTSSSIFKDQPGRKAIQMESDSGTAGYQRWAMLTFLHWRVTAADLQRLLPEGLTVEEFDGSAWLGVVPFSMERVRPWWSPPVPKVSWFLETNVRTYVIDKRGVSGVWFFSLNANSRLAVNVARTFWHLPYILATMSLNVHRKAARFVPSAVDYHGVRRESPAAEYEISVQLPDVKPDPAEPATLEHFLVERYLLFAMDGNKRLSTGRVHHQPYQIVTPTSVSGTQTLTTAIGCNNLDPARPDHAAWCAGVDVRVSPLTIITETQQAARIVD